VDASTNETGFIIERSTTSGSGFTLVFTTAANATSYSNTGLTANTTYYYRIRSSNGVGGSANTAEVVVATSVPAIPTNPFASLSNTSGQVTITWTDVSNNETGFQIERSTTPGANFAWVVTTAANATSFLNTGLTPGATYYYRVRSLNLVGYSNYSPEVQVTIAAPSAPGSFLGVPASPTQINLTWVDPATFETGFSLERSTTSSTAGFSVLASLPPNTTSIQMLD
jgi:predicted phage tail protein